ncbi:MAG: AAA family ATPase [Candidatus Omnitrophota bacterium]|nr:AAA family ATPase [Candidatus Omnitrophota bacterium]
MTTRHPQNLDFNEQFARAYGLMENGQQNLFITGKAGTGKSTLLQYFRANTRKNVAVLAPTGVAAVNVKGQTIHSFFGFKPDITPVAVRAIRVGKTRKMMYQKLEAIIIDEISMVRADLLDCVDAFLRSRGPCADAPFGGVQMIFIGDLYQLPPVVGAAERAVFGGGNGKTMYRSPYFFDAKVLEDFQAEVVELEKIYRQKDDDFIGLLNAVRNNSVTEEHLKVLNSRCIPDFTPGTDELYIHLTTTNDLANRINEQRLNALPGRTSRYEGRMTGDFDFKSLPTQEILCLKTGAQVMLLNNDPGGRWNNGSLGKIIAIEKDAEDPDIIRVELTDGDEVEVSPYTWEMFRFFYNEKTGTLDSEEVGSFTQYPLRLGWAVTIHKGQGKTFSRIIVDIGRGTFAHGQMYVALSRCTSLEGLVLKKPILKKHILMDWRVVKFMTGYQYRRAEELYPLDRKRKILEQAIEDEKAVDIVYLKAGDEKTRRTIGPRAVGEMEYLGKTYLGVEAYCFKRKDIRAFRLDRILEIRESASPLKR